MAFKQNKQLDAFSTVGTGLPFVTASGVVTPRTITASNGISIANGAGIAGNPTVTGLTATTSQVGVLGLPSVVTMTAGTSIVDAVTPFNIGSIQQAQSWTPSIYGSSVVGTITYSAQSGVFSTMAGLCFVSGSFTINNVAGSGASGNVTIDMPVAHSVTAAVALLTVQNISNAMPANCSQVFLYGTSGSRSFRFVQNMTNGAGETLLQISNLSNGATFSFSGSYPIV